jgi:hypothetical protein
VWYRISSPSNGLEASRGGGVPPDKLPDLATGREDTFGGIAFELGIEPERSSAG